MSNTDIAAVSLLQRLPPGLAALLAHVPGLAAAGILFGMGAGIPLCLLALLVGGLACAIAVWWRLPPWWRYINLGFVPLLWLVFQVDLDSRWFLGGFLLLAVTSLGAVRTRVPLYLSSRRASEELARRIPEHGRFMDLGCGLGGPLARISRLRPDVSLGGVEAAPLNWLIAKLRLAGRARIALGSLWNADLDQCDVVYAYLSPAPMTRLWEKARAQMKPGSLFISNTFAVPEAAPDEVLEPDERSHARLLIWRM
jgi:SAM-dependent methyltransferase